MLAKKNRIGQRRRIAWLIQKGHEFKTPHFIFRFSEKLSPPPEFAITVSQKVQAKAVDRNRLKRQVSEGIRISLEQLKKNISVVVIVRARAAGIQTQEILNELIQFFNSLRDHAK